jgi:cation diffusion facilitator CzcD-associated flavoprotein CzcO
MPTEHETPTHFDVIIVGAGLSGVGAASHLARECPDKTFAIIESRSAVGGTWDLFRYPGVRSDSDMFTLGYDFRPWTGAKAIADGASIRDYIRDTIAEEDLSAHLRLNTRVISAEFSSVTALWTLTALRTGLAEEPPAENTPQTVSFTCSFLSACSGYYSYAEGFTPAIPGLEDFAGRIVHPQHWPNDLDYFDKRVVVIGSGATAVTIVPALARFAGHVTMLQRSPSYVAARPSVDVMADRIRGFLPARLAHGLIRAKNILSGILTFELSRRRPGTLRGWLRRAAAAELPAGFDVDTHFGPAYDPWDQRLCVAADGDLFASISQGDAEIVTAHIERITTQGIDLAGGEHVEAEIIVMATGLNLLAIGGMSLSVDGREIALGDTSAYKGMMLSGVPNFSLTLGYTNAAWTLKADLVSRYVTRLLKYLDATGFQTVTPASPRHAADESQVPLVELQSGYIRRGLDTLPRQRARAPWRLNQNYLQDSRQLRRRPVTDGVRFGHATG